MIRAARSATLLVAFYLLTSATTAYAECAWVLWFKMGGNAGDPSGWQPEDIFDSRKLCVEKIARIKQQFDADRLSTGWYVLGAQRETSETRVSYRLTRDSSWDHAHCLPDTMDPRWPHVGR